MSEFFRRPWDSQPQEFTPANQGHPSATGLAGLWLPLGGGLVDVVGRMGNMAATGATKTVTTKGIAHDVTGASSYLTNTEQTGCTNVPLSLSIWVYPDSLPGNHRVFDISTGTTANDVIGIQFGLDGGSKINAQHYDGTTNSVAAASASGMVGAWTHVVAVFESLSSRKLYLNGALVATNTTSVVAPSGINRVTIGYAPWASGEYFDGRVLAPKLWTRALTAAEVLEDYRNPWQLFEPQRIFIPVAAAASGVPTLSLPTYMPGSLTSVGFRPRVTAT